MDWDLNCDLGEGEPGARTEALFRLITSANVACGGHAGDVMSIRHCASLACRHGVRLGAHPGLSGDFGRGTAALSPMQLGELVAQQVRTLIHGVSATGIALHHVKLHGSLYHLADSSEDHARRYLTTVRELGRELGRELRVYARARGRVAALAVEHGLEAWPEIFLDRRYQPDGQLLPRDLRNALLSTAEAESRAREWVITGRVRAVDGSWIALTAKTLCLHGDNPDAEALARRINKLRQN